MTSGANGHGSLLRKQPSPSSPECLAVVLLWGSIRLPLLAEKETLNPQTAQQAPLSPLLELGGGECGEESAARPGTA